MSAPIDLRPVGGLTLDEIIRSLEDDDQQEIEIAIMPPVNACDPLTDEDSGDEEQLNINNLPGSQLRAPAELFKKHSIAQSTPPPKAEATSPIQESDSDDDRPLSERQVVRNQKTRRKAPIKRTYNWQKRDIQNPEVEVPPIQGCSNENTPIELFHCFWDHAIDLFVEHSNNYAAQHNKPANITKDEIDSFFGILLLSGYVPVPRRRMFWENNKDTRNDLAVNALSRDRFEYIFSNLHCCNNNLLDKSDRYAKIRPLINEMNKVFQMYAPISENHSVDESMVPYYGKHGCKQFIRGKPIRYGYKIWTGTTDKGYVVWIEPYQGAGSEIREEYQQFGLGPSIVLQYADTLLTIQKYPYHIFCDNFFTTIPLTDELKRRDIRITGTIRDNRTSNCKLISHLEMKKKERGFMDFKSNENGTVVVKWNDNSIVSLASNGVPINPVHPVSRYSVKEKKRIKVDQPENLFVYNKHMGGVDRADQNISLYRVAFRGKKWYIPLLFHMLDLACHNAWQLHKTQRGKLDNLSFRRRVAAAILERHQRKFAKRSRPSSLENIDSRYDRMDHLIITQEKQTRCRLCHKKVSTRCEKCDVALHVICFKPYHTTQRL